MFWLEVCLNNNHHCLNLLYDFAEWVMNVTWKAGSKIIKERWKNSHRRKTDVWSALSWRSSNTFVEINLFVCFFAIVLVIMMNFSSIFLTSVLYLGYRVSLNPLVCILEKLHFRLLETKQIVEWHHLLILWVLFFLLHLALLDLVLKRFDEAKLDKRRNFVNI